MVSKKILTLILIFSTVGILFSASALAEITTNKESKVHEKVLESFEKDNKDEVKVIVQMEETSKVQANSIRSQAIDAVGKGNVRHTFSSFNGFSATVTEEELDKLRKQKDVARVSYDYPVTTHLDDSVPLINANTTWNLQPEGTNLTGKDQTVCVIDSGVDYNHSDLGGEWGNKVIAGYRSLENENDQQNCSENHSACMDDYGHGTHVAGIVAADGDVKGVARGANIAAVKAMNETGSGYSSDIMYGVEWCTNESERLNISTMTLSLGLINSTTDEEILHETYCDREEDYGALKEPIDQAVGKNITVSIATGNAGNETAVGVPACMENATRVGATD
ncbi:MAG: S8 family serine peptidase, partial [Candidatus Aenigmatarchaeota archaeon]